MKLYLVEKQDEAVKLAQLLKLNSECAKLHWSRSFKNVPQNVVDSLETIESFVENMVYDVCNDKNSFGEFSKEEEAELMSALKKMPELKASLGMGVVLAGDDAKMVKKLIKGKSIPELIEKAIDTGKNVIIF